MNLVLGAACRAFMDDSQDSDGTTESDGSGTTDSDEAGFEQVAPPPPFGC